MERLFPDRKHDGMFQNPDDESFYDFYDVMKSDDPKKVLGETIAYYPEGIPPEKDFFIFISGLGQVAKESSKRSCRYAEKLQVGVVNLNNASFLKENAIFEFLNPYMDWIDAGFDRLGISGSPVIEHAAQLIYFAAAKEIKVNLAADSHGTIFLSRAIRRAQHKFLMTHGFNKALWEERTREFVNVVTFGNGHRSWPKGPNYVMVSIQGDPLPERVGLTPERAEDRPDVHFLQFDALFPEGSFEAHNMMFTIELLRTTFEKNDLEVGVTPALLSKLQQNTCEIASPKDVTWPADLPEYTWDPTSLDAVGMTTARGQMNSDRPVIVGPSDEYLSPIMWTLFIAVGATLIQRKFIGNRRQ